MADKKKSGISAMPEFVDGEQPSAQKFNSIGAQVKYSDYNLELSIGDIWNESYPYSTISDTKLSLDSIKITGSEFVDPNSLGKDLDIVSLGRLIGPASNLNPRSITYDENGVAENSISGERVPGGIHSFTLKYLPSVLPVFSDASVFSNRVTSASALANSGDYYISSNGTVITVTKTSSNGTVDYSTRPNVYKGGRSYIGSTHNVIPDPAQIVTNLSFSEQHLEIIQESDGVYFVRLPRMYKNSGNKTGTSNNIDVDDPAFGKRYTLPISVMLACGSDLASLGVDSGLPGSEIPQGCLYLKNESTKELYFEATYYYVDNISFRIQTTKVLDVNNDHFSVITTGTNITSSIQDINEKLSTHSHSRDYGEPLVSIEDIDDIFKREGDSGIFVPSVIRNNYTPQYLHRDGSRDTGDIGLNDNNAIRGNLVIGRRQDANGNDIVEAGEYLGEGSSFYLNFGRNSSSASRIGRYYNASTNEGLMQIQSGGGSGVQIYGEENIQLLSNSSSPDAIELLALSGGIQIESGIYNVIKSPINIISSESNVAEPYAQSVPGMALGDYTGVRSFQNVNFKNSAVNGIWYVPQLKTVSFHQSNMRLIGKNFQDGSDVTSVGATDYWEVRIPLPLDLTHGDNPSIVNGVNVQSEAVILPHMISCIVRRSNSALNSASWWTVGNSTYVQGAQDFHMNGTGAKDIGDSPMANAVGVLEGSAYNSGELNYRILIDADEGPDVPGAPNDFSKEYGLLAVGPKAVIECDVVLTIWYMQGGYP